MMRRAFFLSSAGTTCQGASFVLVARDNAEFFKVHFHDVENYLRLPMSETAPEQRGDLRIPICVLKIRCAATGPVRAAIGNDTPWCNGNTAPFGGVIHGSNPCGVVNRA